jgi:hypothetical protein
MFNCEHKRILTLAIVALMSASNSSCLRSEVLSPEPSALDLDSSAPSCPGLTGVTVGSGPSLTVNWGQASDQVTQASNITYSIFMRSGNSNYDLVSPAKIILGATQTLILSGVQLGQTYTLFVTCRDEKGNVSPASPRNEISVTVADTIAPAAPAGLNVGSPNFTSLLLTWSPADDGQGGTTASQMKYRVYRSTSASVETSGSPLASITAATTYSDQNLTPGTTYYYRVVAEDLAANLSIASNEASNTTLSDLTPPTFVPALAATGVTESQMLLSWSSGSDNVTTAGQLVYRLYRCAGSTTCDPYAGAYFFESAPGQSSYTNSGLVANTVYVFGIRARDASGNVSTNTDRLVTSTAYNSLGTFDVFPSNQEVAILFGQSVAVANVVGAASGATAYPDLIVGAPNASEPGYYRARTGCVYIFPGTATGVFSTTPSQTICQPGSPASDGANNRNFGFSMVSGDLDDNGTADLVVGAPQQDRFFIFRSVNSSGSLSIGTSPTTITRAAGGTSFSWGLCLGNSDGVGAPDIFALSILENCSGGCSGLTATGNVIVYNNSSTAGAWFIPSFTQSFSPTASLIASGYNLSNNEYTARSCTVGKFDPSDPTQEVLILGSGTVDHDSAATGNDGIISFYRRTSANNWAFQNPISAFLNSPPQLRDGLWGEAVRAVQVDDVGETPELFVGSPSDNSAGTGAGAIYGYRVSTSAGNFVLQDLGTYFYGGSDQVNNGAGYAIATANIWGHTGSRQDLVIGAPFDDRSLVAAATSIDTGDVFTYRNTAGVISSAIQQQNFDISAVNARIYNEFGASLCKGDVNNDGEEDVMVGSPAQSYDPTSLTFVNGGQGALYVYYGKDKGEIDFANPNKVIFGPGNQGGARFGQSCVVMDYNADGKKDLLIGSPQRTVGPNGNRGVIYVYYGSTNSELQSSPSVTLNSPPISSNIWFGWSIATGDIDANGYDDLIVGSPYWDTGSTDSGGAWVFWANDATGVIMPTTSVATLLPPFGNPSTSGNPHLATTQQVGNGGSIVAMSRSANVVTVTTAQSHGLVAGNTVGVWNSSSPSGNQFNWFWTVSNVPSATQFQFSQAGPNESATGLTEAFFRRYTQNSMHFGWSVAAFPTVAGSPGKDVIVCAPWIDTANAYIDPGITARTDLGNCYIYEGKVNGGLAGSYRIMSSPRNEIRYPFGATAFDSNNLYFGTSMALGDWNFDGREDLVICAFRMRNLDIGVSNLGGCFAYYGRTLGIGGFESNQSYLSNFGGLRFVPLSDDAHFNERLETEVSNFGYSVLLVDINNNIRPDLMVGEPAADNNCATCPVNLGRDSGRVYVIRGGY